MDGSDFPFQVDLIHAVDQMDGYPANSCAISPTAFLLHTLARLQRSKSMPVISMILFTNNRNRLNEYRNRMKISSYSSRVNNVNKY